MKKLISTHQPRKAIIFAVVFAAIGALSLLYSFAASSTDTKVFEAESTSTSGSIEVKSDNNASGGQYVAFGSGPGSSSGERPTLANTGPRFAMTDMTPSEFFSTRTCNRQRITGTINFDQTWMKGQTFSLTDCEITGGVTVYIQGGGAILSTADMPIINMSYVYMSGGIYTLNAVKLTADHIYVANAGQWGLKDVWGPFISGPAPYRITNSVFYGVYRTQPAHTEALHVGDYGVGYEFINVAFEQQGGPLENTGVTAAINFHGDNALFDGCWFIFDGPIPAYYAAYLDAKNSIVRNSYFESNSGGYIYPDSANNPVYENNFDFTTGNPIDL